VTAHHCNCRDCQVLILDRARLLATLRSIHDSLTTAAVVLDSARWQAIQYDGKVPWPWSEWYAAQLRGEGDGGEGASRE